MITFAPLWKTMQRKKVSQYQLLKKGLDNKTLDALKKIIISRFSRLRNFVCCLTALQMMLYSSSQIIGNNICSSNWSALNIFPVAAYQFFLSAKCCRTSSDEIQLFSSPDACPITKSSIRSCFDCSSRISPSS